MRTIVNAALFTVGLLLSVSCMKGERVMTGGGGGNGGGSINSNGTASILTGDQRLHKNLSAMGMAINADILTQYGQSSRNIMPFSGIAEGVNPVNTYAGTMDAMRVALLSVNTGIAGNGTAENRDIFAPARAVSATNFSQVEFLEVAELAGQRLLRRSLMPAEKEVLKTEIFDRIKGTAAMSATLRVNTLTAMVASIMMSMDNIAAN